MKLTGRRQALLCCRLDLVAFELEPLCPPTTGAHVLVEFESTIKLVPIPFKVPASISPS